MNKTKYIPDVIISLGAATPKQVRTFKKKWNKLNKWNKLFKKLPKGCEKCKETKTCRYLKMNDPIRCKKRNALKNEMSFKEIRSIEKDCKKKKRR